jgi:hypothetical protein
MMPGKESTEIIGCFQIPLRRDYNRHLFGLWPKIQATRFAGGRWLFYFNYHQRDIV